MPESPSSTTGSPASIQAPPAVAPGGPGLMSGIGSWLKSASRLMRGNLASMASRIRRRAARSSTSAASTSARYPRWVVVLGLRSRPAGRPRRGRWAARSVLSIAACGRRRAAGSAEPGQRLRCGDSSRPGQQLVVAGQRRAGRSGTDGPSGQRCTGRIGRPRPAGGPRRDHLRVATAQAERRVHPASTAAAGKVRCNSSISIRARVPAPSPRLRRAASQNR